MSGKNCLIGRETTCRFPARGDDYPAKNQNSMINGQNHVIGSKVDRVYLLDDYVDDKCEAGTSWAIDWKPFSVHPMWLA